MSINEWLGDASPVAQVVRVTIETAAIGRTYTMEINGKTVSFTVTEDSEFNATNGYVDAATRGLATAINAGASTLAAYSGIAATVTEGLDGEALYLEVSGNSDGTPFTYEAGTGINVAVTEDVAGVVGRNMRQTIYLPGSPSGGTFIVTALGATTAGIAYNASAATVKTALEGLFGAGNVDVTGSAGGPWVVETKGVYARRDVDAIAVGSGADLSGLLVVDASSVTQSSYGLISRVVQRGKGRKNEKQMIRSIGTFTGGSYKLFLAGSTSAATVAYNANAATVKTAIESLSGVGAGNVSVSGDLVNGFLIEFIEALGGTNVPQLTASSDPGGVLTGGGVAEIKTVTEGGTTWGAGKVATDPWTFRIRYTETANAAGAIAASIQHPATGDISPIVWGTTESAATIQARLASLTGWTASDWVVSEFDGGVDIGVVGIANSYAWTVVKGETDPGQFLISSGGTIEVLHDPTTATTATTWHLSWRGFYGSITVAAPSRDDPATTASFTFSVTDSASTILTALLTAHAALTVSEYTAGDLNGVGRVLAFTYNAPLGMSPRAPRPIAATLGTNTGPSIESFKLQEGAVGINTIHELTYLGFPSGGTVTISGPNATSATLTRGSEQTGLDAAFGSGQATVIRRDDYTGAIRIEWRGQTYRGLSVDAPTLTSNALSGTLGVSRILERSRPDVPEEQLISITNATGGTFTLSFSGQTTGSIPYNADGSQIQTSLEALSNIAPGDIVVEGDSGGPWRVVFLPSLAAGANPPLISVTSSLTTDADLLVVAILRTSATGPCHWSDANNWSLGRAPTTGDTVLLRRPNRPLLYDLSQASVTPARLVITSEFNAAVGLPDYIDGYAVTLDRELTLGTAGAGVFYVEIGSGSGQGSGRIRLNTGGKETHLSCYLSASAADDEAVAVQWRGTHASNIVEAYRGSLGIALDGSAATVATLRVGYVSSRENDATVVVGENVTLGDVVKTGSSATIYADTTSIENSGGDLSVRGSSSHDLIEVSGGIVSYDSDGTLTDATISGDGILSFASDLRPKTVTNPIEVFGDEADVDDPNQVVASLTIKYNRTTRSPRLGSNYQIVRTIL